MINPDGLGCELEGFELASDFTDYQCPDGTTITCIGPGWICKSADGEVMGTIDRGCGKGEELDAFSGSCAAVGCESPKACPQSTHICVHKEVHCLKSPCPQFRCEPKPTRVCCFAMISECLACEKGVSEAEFCSHPGNRHVVGCDKWPLVEAEESKCRTGFSDHSDPCEPKECIDGRWMGTVIDCADMFGIPCDDGFHYGEARPGECCKPCVPDEKCGDGEVVCTNEMIAQGVNCAVGFCIDGAGMYCNEAKAKVDLSNPCEPKTCVKGIWTIEVVDCAKSLGITCDPGFHYGESKDDECCEVCLPDDFCTGGQVTCTVALQAQGLNCALGSCVDDVVCKTGDKDRFDPCRPKECVNKRWRTKTINCANNVPCKEGFHYVNPKNDQCCGECVPDACPAGMQWTKCGSACPFVCGEDPGPCVMVCVPGCVCKKETPFLENRGSNVCLSEEQCPNLDTCMDCVDAGKVWANDECLSACDEIADTACYEGRDGCAQMRDDRRLEKHCGEATSCKQCLTSDIECVFMGNSCYSARNMYNLPDMSIREADHCDHDIRMQQCSHCIGMGMNWYAGDGKDLDPGCMVDCSSMPRCYAGNEGCNQWMDDIAIDLLCHAQETCTKCTGVHKDCIWQGECMSTRNMWDTGDNPINTPTECTSMSKRDTCESCIKRGLSWAVGGCLPSCDWIADAPCYEGRTGCKEYYHDQKMKQLCGQKNTCLECMETSSECSWLNGFCLSGIVWRTADGLITDWLDCGSAPQTLANTPILSHHLLNRIRTGILCTHPYNFELQVGETTRAWGHCDGLCGADGNIIWDCVCMCEHGTPVGNDVCEAGDPWNCASCHEGWYGEHCDSEDPNDAVEPTLSKSHTTLQSEDYTKLAIAFGASGVFGVIAALLYSRSQKESADLDDVLLEEPQA